MHRDACCSTIVYIYNVNRWQIEVVQHSLPYKIAIRPMKLDYQFLAQIFENLMRAGGYYSLFIIFPKAQHTSKHEDFCQKTVRSTLITLALNS